MKGGFTEIRDRAGERGRKMQERRGKENSSRAINPQ
jgi:hypothetical protein